MPASTERIREVVHRYVDLVASGTTDEIMALYAEGATLEDPVGSEVRAGLAALRTFYASLEGLERETQLLGTRIAGGQAAFLFEVITVVDGARITVAPIEVMTFDDAGQITSMRAFWGDDDMVVV